MDAHVGEMSSLDRIQPIAPTVLQSQPSSGVQMRKEGRGQQPDQPKKDSLELHEEVLEDVEGEMKPVQSESEHRLDLTA